MNKLNAFMDRLLTAFLARRERKREEERQRLLGRVGQFMSDAKAKAEERK